ncbi:hypothetical protein Emed_005427 [Eimeria media]
MRAPLSEAAVHHPGPHLLVIERRRSSSRSSSSCSYRAGSCCRCTGPCLQRCSHAAAMPATACPCSSSRRPRTAAETAAGSTAAAAAAVAASNAAAAPAAVAAPARSSAASTSPCALSHIGLSATHTRKEPLILPCFPHKPGEAAGARVHHSPSGSSFDWQQREAKGAARCERISSCVVSQRDINTQESRRRCSSNTKSSSGLGTWEPQHLLQPAHLQQQQQQQPQQQQQQRRTSWKPQQPSLFHRPPQHYERRMHTAEHEGWSYPDCCSSTQATVHRRTSVNASRCSNPAAAAAAAAASGGSASPAAAISCHRNNRSCQQAASAAAADTEEHCISPLASAGPRGRRSFNHPPTHPCPAAGRHSNCEKQRRASTAAAAAAAVNPAANGVAASHVSSHPSRLRRASESVVRAASMSSAREVSAALTVRSSKSSSSAVKSLQRRRYSSDAVRVNPEPVLSQHRGSGQQALHQRQRQQQQQRHKQPLIAQQDVQQRHQRQQPQQQQQQEASEPCIDFEYSLFSQATGVNDTSSSAHQQRQQFVVLERLQVHRRQRSHPHMAAAKEREGESLVKASSKREAACPCAVGLPVRTEHGDSGGQAASASVGVATAAKLEVAAAAAAATTEISLKGPGIFSQNSAIPKACSSDGRQHAGQAQQQQVVKQQQLLPQLQRQQLYASAVLERLFRVFERSAYRRPWMMLLCHAAQRPAQQQQLLHAKEEEKPLADQTSTELEGLSTTEEVSSIDTCMRLEVYRRRLQHQEQRRKQQQQRQKEQHKQHKQQRQQLSQQLAAAAHELKKANDQQEILQERLAAALTRLKHLEQQQQHRGLD